MTAALGSASGIAAALLAGLVAGVLSGLFGIGGGIAMVPLLVAFLGLTQHRAHATSLGAIILIAMAAAVQYALEEQIDYGVAALLGIGALVGAPLGARLMARSSEGLLKMMFGLLMIVVAVRLLWP